MLPALPSAKLLITSLTLAMSLINPAAGGSLPARTDSQTCGTGTCLSTRTPSQDETNHQHDGDKVPRHFGFLLPPSFAPLDVFGPLEVFQALARQTHLELAMLARNRDVATTSPYNSSTSLNRFNSSFFPSVLPTHSYADNPPIDVLVVPGGMAARNPDLGPEIAYIKKVFPRLKYLVTICTGAGIAAQSGVLDGHRVTTNKSAWKTILAMGPNVKWVSPARWVEDGKVWSSSGVTAGIDLALEFIRKKYDNGTAIAQAIAGGIEHTPILDWREDPWAEYFGVTPQN